jgi:hypothetical protein
MKNFVIGTAILPVWENQFQIATMAEEGFEFSEPGICITEAKKESSRWEWG